MNREIKRNLLKKRNILCATAALTAATVLAGCGKKDKEYLLQGTILEQSVITEINHEKTIAKLLGHQLTDGSWHFHYQEIGGGVLYNDEEKCDIPSAVKISTPDFENILTYLTD